MLEERSLKKYDRNVLAFCQGELLRLTERVLFEESNAGVVVIAIAIIASQLLLAGV